MMDLKALEKAALRHRTAVVAVPQLADVPGLYADGEAAEWTVRGLSGQELGWVNEGQSRTEELRALVLALSGSGAEEKAAAVREFLGLDSDKVPPSVRRQVDILCLGSVNPAIGDENRQLVLVLATHYPGTFLKLVNKIEELTGLGSEPGKPKGSGKTPPSVTG